VLLVGAALFAAYGAGSARADNSPAYSVSDVPDYNQLHTCPIEEAHPHQDVASGINNAGVVVGWTDYFCGDGSWYGYTYSNGAVTLLGGLNDAWISAASSINDSGQVVGWSGVEAGLGGPSVAFLSSNGVMTGLYPFGAPDSCGSTATDINNSGEIVGSDRCLPHQRGGFLVSNGEVQDLGAFIPSAINDPGTVAGADGGHAFMDSNGVLRDLNDLLPAGSGWVLNTAAALNDAGQVVGTGTLNGAAQAYELDLGSGSITDIGSFTPTDINDYGQVVGNGDACGCPELEQDGIVTPLSTLIPADSGWQLNSVTGINDRGQIVGNGRSPLESVHDFPTQPPTALHLAHGFILTDVTPPTASPTQSPPASATGWNNTDVTVTWNWSDAGSGVDPTSCTTSSTSSGEGTITLNATCDDHAGNTGNASYTIMVDKTPPSVTYTGNAGTYDVLDNVAITCTAADTLSGVAASTCATINGPAWSFGAGTHTFSASATDNAGNAGTGSTTFTVEVPADQLCTLTSQFIQSSSKYQSLRSGAKGVFNALLGGACSRLSSLGPHTNPARKERFIDGYGWAVDALLTSGWLTKDQEHTLISLAAAL
jgi:probable HAF family extracellular repeat protein